jgi:hypothetical protein
MNDGGDEEFSQGDLEGFLFILCVFIWVVALTLPGNI